MKNYTPPIAGNFGFLLQAMIGPHGEEGEESFELLVCTPKWLLDHSSQGDIVVGGHHLIVFEYSYERLANHISSYWEQCSGAQWTEVAAKVGRLGKWEFEDYQPTA